MKPCCILAILLVLVTSAAAQQPAGSLLVVETAHHTQYTRNISDYSVFATQPSPTTGVVPSSFGQSVFIADIASVNGEPAKGTVLEISYGLNLRPDAPAGQAIADVTRAGFVQWYFEFLDAEGRFIGSIQVSGATQGSTPPGQTSQILSGSFSVIGGNGAFLGARGYMGSVGGSSGLASVRTASVSEDPANRRVNGGGAIRQGIFVIPMVTPEVAAVNGAPAIVHSTDFSLVTPSKPAKAGEILTIWATGLGPTRPGVEPGTPFTADPPQLCNSPIEVLVNGKSSEVLFAGGYPGAADGYQINFRVPDTTPAGAATVQIKSAWIAGDPVKIMMQ
jgi:uncharacterized protein (TIGR03437 family)